MSRLVLGACILLLLCGVAQARPRDDAMARAYRCAAQPVTRVWLDCYYGAAQPVRAALGMPPASPAQVALSEAAPGGGVPTDGPLRDAAMMDAARCGTLAEDRAWLTCFYAATNPVRASLGLPPMAGAPVIARAAQPLPPAPPPPAPVHQRTVPGLLPGVFGKTVVDGEGRMVSYSFDAEKNFTVTLDNGQVWRQISGDSSKAAWFKPAGTYQVIITSGALGSHNLTVKNQPGLFKVRRVS